jgi:hypothetical protein
MYFSAAPFLGERPRQHEFGFEDRAGCGHHPVQGGRHPPDYRVIHPPLDVLNRVACVSLIPAPVEVLGCAPNLDDQISRQVLGFDLAAFLTPEAQQ